MRLKIRDSHLRCKTAIEFLNVCQSLEVVERNKDDPLPSLAFLKIVSVRERKKEIEKN